MKASDLSPLFPITFAENPTPDTIRPIPVEKPGKGMASLQRGFPNETQIPLAAGGSPPDGRDMNGILNMLSRAIRAYEAGEIRPFNADYAQQIGGYPQGAMVVADMPSSTPAPSAPTAEDFARYSTFPNINSVMLAALQQQKKDAEAAAAAGPPAPRLLISLRDDNVTDPANDDGTMWYDLTGGLLSKDAADKAYQPKGNYIQSNPSDNDYRVDFAGINKETGIPWFNNADLKQLLQLASVDFVNKASPPGIPMPWPTQTPPEGWLLCDGSDFDKTKYPLLARAYATGKLPDLRGYFLRGYDPRGVVDPDGQTRGLLSSQWDAIGRHSHQYGTYTFRYGSYSGGGYNSMAEYYTSSAETGTTGIDETRPRNISFNYIVRAA